ncbi:hypothetical protein FGG08_000501 [Glutinoglossum americanum]|uniref:Uncharacterized protein n=1 Tax=Glutinoglossum americanum TaxID=1670608 RepID=A0A9P8ICZ2_9PEZI|nr:hypothetical protein FGG08_000501 [Glutinoglossum americanum]
MNGAMTGYNCAATGGSANIAAVTNVFSSGCIPDSTSTSSTTSDTSTTTKSSSSTSSQTSTGTNAAGAATDSPISTSSPDSKLSRGAVAGIVIAALAVFTALAGGILFFVISHKRVTKETAAAAAEENENDKTFGTGSTCTPPLTQTPSRQSGRPYSIQSTRTPPSGYYAVPTNHPDAIHQTHLHHQPGSPAIPQKSNLRHSNPISTSVAAAAVVGGSPIKGPSRVRRYSTPTPAGGRMSPAEEEPEGGDADSIQTTPPMPQFAPGAASRGVSPFQNPPPVPPPGQGFVVRRPSPQQSPPPAPSPAPSARSGRSGSGSGAETGAMKKFYGIPPPR